MKLPDATTLAREIRNQWDGPSLATWVNALTDLHHHQALKTFEQLTNEHLDRRLLPAEFRHAYKALTVPDATVKVDCTFCDNTGWREVLDDRRHNKWCHDRTTCRCSLMERCKHPSSPPRARSREISWHESTWYREHVESDQCPPTGMQRPLLDAEGF